jgi:hypothetical protein
MFKSILVAFWTSACLHHPHLTGDLSEVVSVTIQHFAPSSNALRYHAQISPLANLVQEGQDDFIT